MLAALTTFVVVQTLQLGVRTFALVNLGLVAIWFFIAFNLSRENRKLTREKETVAA
jgi:hypothetical protein